MWFLKLLILVNVLPQIKQVSELGAESVTGGSDDPSDVVEATALPAGTSNWSHSNKSILRIALNTCLVKIQYRISQSIFHLRPPDKISASSSLILDVQYDTV
jgi:hypothetical protein